MSFYPSHLSLVTGVNRVHASSFKDKRIILKAKKSFRSWRESKQQQQPVNIKQQSDKQFNSNRGNGQAAKSEE